MPGDPTNFDGSLAFQLPKAAGLLRFRLAESRCLFWQRSVPRTAGPHSFSVQEYTCRAPRSIRNRAWVRVCRSAEPTPAESQDSVACRASRRLRHRRSAYLVSLGDTMNGATGFLLGFFAGTMAVGVVVVAIWFWKT